MFSLAQLTSLQFKFLCNEIGNEKVISFAEKIKLFGGNIGYSKKYQNYRNEKMIEKFMFEKRYSPSLQRFFDDEIKKKGYNNLEGYYKQVLVKLKNDNEQENKTTKEYKTENTVEIKEWFPSIEEYNPNFTIDDWLNLLADKNVFDDESYTILLNIYDNGGQASCKELSEKYGNSYQYYISKTVNLAKRIHKKTNCPIHKTDDSETTWFTILFLGKYIIDNDNKRYVWKIRDELYKAINIVSREQNIVSVNSWLLAYSLEKYDWENAVEEYSFDTMLKRVRNGGAYFDTWKSINSRIKEGDLIYIIKLGKEPQGIIAKGYAVSDSYIFADQKSVDIIITDAFDYRNEPIISIDNFLKENPGQHWSPQISCIELKTEAAKWLIDNWNSHTEEKSEEEESELLSPSNSEFLKYFAPLIQALKDLGGSATRKEAHEKVIELMDITEEELNVTYEKTGASRVLNLIDFARNDLAHEGFISSGTKGVWALTELGMNTDMTRELAGHIHMKWVKINTAKRKGKPIPEIDLSKYYKKKVDHKYTKDDFLKEVFLSESEYDKLRSLVLRKKNIILQGAPGVGKTFSAKRLAYSIIGEENENRICMVQFHQNYSYEDFIMGYRPNDSGGFELQSGAFFNFCERCKENPGKPYFFIIDEINRGNLSKIFGELLMLIETDKRGEKHKMNLVYGGTAFYIPENLHIIGMMNTADRSLAMIDYALRRRFSFYTMQPAFDNADQNGFGIYTKDVKCDLYHTVINKIKELNNNIRKDNTLGKGFEIGHSYFAPEDKSVIDDEWVRGVVEYEIIPLIEEYWFDDDKKREDWSETLHQTIGD